MKGPTQALPLINFRPRGPAGLRLLRAYGPLPCVPIKIRPYRPIFGTPHFSFGTPRLGRWGVARISTGQVVVWRSGSSISQSRKTVVEHNTINDHMAKPELLILLSRMMAWVAFHTKATFSVLVASVTWQ